VALAAAGSVAVHAAVALLFWGVSVGAEPKPPAMRIYKVDIVSPPPNQAGPTMAEPPMESPAGPAASAGAPAEAPAPETPVPAPPTPRPTPPKPAPVPAPPAAREPRPAPAPTTKPTTTAPTPPRPSADRPPARPAPPKPATPAPATGTRTNAPPASTRPGLGTTGTGRRPVPATGAAPVVSSAGGEGLNVRTAGADFVDRAYLENIIRQVRRYFRPPPGSVSDRASVRFWIERDGSVSELGLAGGSGSFAFRTAALEAVERAGKDGAFGRLPAGFPDDRLAVTFDFTPPR
jgi:outer membrane biosynthesis protein TonB